MVLTMARIIPSDLTTLALQGAHPPEIETLGYLERALPDAYRVFHGVHWTRQYRGITVYGEIDFVILTSDGRILCIEQKNGRIEERDGKLIKIYEDGGKDVARQLHRSIESIRKKFEHVNGSAHPLSIEYLIYCPDAALKKIQAAGLDEARIIDASAKDDLAKRIEVLLPYGQSPRTDFGSVVEDFFNQSFEVVPDIHQHIDVQESNFTRLSGGLVDMLANLEMEPLRLRVHATAGNGKTHLARFFYERMIREGKRPLLMCFNRPLAERLKHLTSSGGVVDTWYGFLDNYLKSIGRPLDFNAMQTNPLFWDKALEFVQESALSGQVGDDWRFDALIVDEGQDFEAPWFETARLFLRNRADILWLEDPNQNVRSVDTVQHTLQHCSVHPRDITGISVHGRQRPAWIRCRRYKVRRSSRTAKAGGKTDWASTDATIRARAHYHRVLEGTGQHGVQGRRAGRQSHHQALHWRL
jgi:Nuclease-related domain